MYRAAKLKILIWVLAMMAETVIASAKTLIVGEQIVETNPWRNDLIKRQYRIAMDQALKFHKLKHPKSKIELIESFDNSPSDGFSLAKKKNAYGVVGYLYSMEAFEASNVAKSNQIPYLTPVSPLDGIKNEYAFSMATSHQQFEGHLKQLRKGGFDHPSIVLMPDTYLPNFEYEKLYKKAFNVDLTLKGKSSEIWEQLTIELKKRTQKEKINILFAGFAFEQMDLVKLLSASPYTEKINLIGHAQWNYCPRLLKASLSGEVKNLFVFTDYFDAPEVQKLSTSITSESIEKYQAIESLLDKEPAIKGHNPKEPIVYVLTDMISMALEAAEKSKSRSEYLKHLESISYNGASGFYQFKDKVSDRKVYLGKWDNKKFIPIKAL